VQWVWHNNRLQCDPQKRAGFVSISGIVRRFCGRLSRGVGGLGTISAMPSAYKNYFVAFTRTARII